MSSLTPEQQAQFGESRQATLYGVLPVLLFLSNASLGLRVLAVIKHRGSLRVEDYIMIVAVVLSDAIIAALLAATAMGFGLHTFRVIYDDPSPPGTLVHIFQIIWAYAVMNGFCFLTIKVSILLFYRRLFFVHDWFRIAWWVNLVYAVMWFLGSTLFYIFQCSPVNLYWMRAEAPFLGPDQQPQGTCESSLASIGTPIIINTVGDVCILLMPIPILVQLHTTWPKRLRLIVLLCIGLVAAISGFIRFAFVFAATTSDDVTYTAVQFLLWSNIEEVLGIVCGNIPLFVSYIEHRNRSPETSHKSSQKLEEDFSRLRGSNSASTLDVIDRHPYVSRGSRHSRHIQPSPYAHHTSDDIELVVKHPYGADREILTDV